MQDNEPSFVGRNLCSRGRRLSSSSHRCIGRVPPVRRQQQQQPPPSHYRTRKMPAASTVDASDAVPLLSLLGTRAATIRDVGRLTVRSSYVGGLSCLHKIGLEQVRVSRLDAADIAARLPRDSAVGDEAGLDRPPDEQAGGSPFRQPFLQPPSADSDATAVLADHGSQGDPGRAIELPSTSPRSPSAPPWLVLPLSPYASPRSPAPPRSPSAPTRSPSAPARSPSAPARSPSAPARSPSALPLSSSASPRPPSAPPRSPSAPPQSPSILPRSPSASRRSPSALPQSSSPRLVSAPGDGHHLMSRDGAGASYFADDLDDNTTLYCDVLSNMSLFSDPDSSCDSPPSPRAALGQSPSGSHRSYSRSGRRVSCRSPPSTPGGDDSTSSTSTDLVPPTRFSFAAVQRDRCRDGSAIPEGRLGRREFGEIASDWVASPLALSGRVASLSDEVTTSAASSLVPADEFAVQLPDSMRTAPLTVPVLQASCTVEERAGSHGLISQSSRLANSADGLDDFHDFEAEDDEANIESVALLRPPSSSPSNASLSLLSNCQQLEDAIEILDDSTNSNSGESRQQRSVGNGESVPTIIHCQSDSSSSSSVLLVCSSKGNGAGSQKEPSTRLPHLHPTAAEASAGSSQALPMSRGQRGQSSVQPLVSLAAASGSHGSTPHLLAPWASLPYLRPSADGGGRHIACSSPVRSSQKSAPSPISPVTSPCLPPASVLQPFCSTPAKPQVRTLLPEVAATASQGAVLDDSNSGRLLPPDAVSPVAAAAATHLADLSDVARPSDDASDAWSLSDSFHSSIDDDDGSCSILADEDTVTTDDSCLEIATSKQLALPGGTRGDERHATSAMRADTAAAVAATAAVAGTPLCWVPEARPPSYDTVSSSCLDFGLAKETSVHPHFTDSADYRKAAKDSMVSACCSKFESRLLSELPEYCGTIAGVTRRPSRLIAAAAAAAGAASGRGGSSATSASVSGNRRHAWAPLRPPPTREAVQRWLAAAAGCCKDAGIVCVERASTVAVAGASVTGTEEITDKCVRAAEAVDRNVADACASSKSAGSRGECLPPSDQALHASGGPVTDCNASLKQLPETECTPSLSLEQKDVADENGACSLRSDASNDIRSAVSTAAAVTAAAPVLRNGISPVDDSEHSSPPTDADLSFDPARRRGCLPSSVLAYDDLPIAAVPQRSLLKTPPPHSDSLVHGAATAATALTPPLPAPAPAIYVTPHNRSSSSLVDGASLDNTYGFERSLYDAPGGNGTTSSGGGDVHREQHLTVMGVEVHANARGSLTADPMVDAVAAIFVHVHSDTDPAAAGDLSIVFNWSPTSSADGRPLSPPHPRQHLSSAGCTRSGEGVSAAGMVENRYRAYGLRHVAVTELDTELDVVMAFVELVKKWNPDILHGWEVESRSLGYLIQRCRFLKLDLLDLLSRTPKNTASPDKVPDDKAPDSASRFDNQQLRIGGRIILNMWRVMRQEVTLNVYTVENVIYHVLHERLPKFTDETLTAWYNNKQLYRWRVLDYYSTRTRCLYRMMDEIDLIGQTSEFARIYGIEFYEVLSRGSQFKVESMMLRLAKPLSYVAVSPSVQQRVRMRAPECIQLTLEPESKFYSDPVVVVDFQSLYPSIMIAYNYCYSTCLGRVESLAKADGDFFPFGCTSNRVPGHILKKLENDVTVSPNGVVFVKQHVRKGILSQMVEEILNTRIMVKQSMKLYGNDKGLQRLLHARQLGLKLIANVTFGYTAANFSGRMPCVEIGDSILRKSRETLESAIKLVETTEKWHARVVYGDTDSMFILLAGRSKDEAFRIGQEIADAVTAANPSPVKLKFEKVYLPCILETKKRYVGYSYESASQKEPLFDAKGIETVRRDGCPAATKVLERALKLLFDTRDITAVKSYVQRQCSKVLDGRTNLLDFVFAKEYRGSKGYKPGACVPSLEIARRRLAADPRSEPLVGERVPYVFVYGRPGAPLIELAREPSHVLAAEGSMRVNGAYYVTKQILPPLGRALSLLGVNVFTWYDELPRTSAVAHDGSASRRGAGHSGGPAGGSSAAGPSDRRRNRGTLSQYFVSSRCLVCGENGRGKLCDGCQSRPQATAISLGRRLQAMEREIQLRHSMCTSCAGFASSQELPCWSLDCTNMTKHRKAQQVLTGSTELYDALFRW